MTQPFGWVIIFRSPLFASGLLPSGYLVVPSSKISLLGFPDKICGLRNHHRFVIL
jgi:hypothetical protein